MRDQRTPVPVPPSETITLAGLARGLALNLEGMYALRQAHGVRVAARPTIGSAATALIAPVYLGKMQLLSAHFAVGS